MKASWGSKEMERQVGPALEKPGPDPGLAGREDDEDRERAIPSGLGATAREAGYMAAFDPLSLSE
jgi:hypothetical protein